MRVPLRWMVVRRAMAALPIDLRSPFLARTWASEADPLEATEEFGIHLRDGIEDIATMLLGVQQVHNLVVQRRPFAYSCCCVVSIFFNIIVRTANGALRLSDESSAGLARFDSR
jgi:hypothetical protein